MSSSTNREAVTRMTKGLTYEEKLKVYELLLALRQNQRPAEARPA